MTTPIRILGFAGSTYVRTARLVCLEKDVPHELVPLEFGAASHVKEHPFAKMPALVHDDVRLFETLAIGSYVNDLGSAPSLLPAAPRERAVALQWISAAIDYVYDDLVRALLADTLPDGARANVNRTLAALDAGIASRPFFAGRELSLADLFLAPMVDFAARKEPELAPREQKNLTRWLDTMRARASMKATAGS